MKSKKEKEKFNLLLFLKNNYYYFIVILVLIVTGIIVISNNNKLDKYENQVYNIILDNKGTFKNPESLKIVSAKVCNSDYSIIRVTANNSFGAETTSTYYINKKTMTTDKLVAKAVAEECLNQEIDNYNSVVVLSTESISKINKLLKGDK